jgi:hypothetical protein
MYEIQDDRVVEIEGVPRPNVGAPLATLVSHEFHLLLGYIISEPDPNWNGAHANVVSPGSPDQSIAIVTLIRPYAHCFGPPNDEALEGHPLAPRGLRHYSVSEVINSSWIRSLERMNSVHPSHRSRHFQQLRHYIFAFHDSTFECVAEGLTVKMHRGSMGSAVRAMVEMLGENAA